MYTGSGTCSVHTESMSVQCSMDLRLDDAQGIHSMNTLLCSNRENA